jgi:hypothetical protein
LTRDEALDACDELIAMVGESPVRNRAARARARLLFDGLKQLSGMGAIARLLLATMPVKFDMQFGSIPSGENESTERASLLTDLARLRERLEAEL